MKKKVLFIIWSFTYGGGAEKILANVVNNLPPEKYDIEILEFLHADIGKESVTENVKLLPPIIDITKKDPISYVKNKLLGKLVYFLPGMIRRLHLNKTYDVEVSFNYLIPTFLLNPKSKKRVSWFHGSVENLEQTKRLKKLQKKYLDKTDWIVSISKKTEQSILSLYPDLQSKLVRIYNGYDFEKMHAKAQSVEPFDLLYCNRLEENKNPLFLLEVAKILKNKGVRFRLNILGSGVLEKKLQTCIAESGLENEVKLLGFISNPYSYFNSCKVFCLTSKAEGFPTTIVEAMSFGKPFVSTPVAGTEELAGNNSCGFVESDVQQYAERIMQLLSDADKYRQMSENCTREVQKYSLKKQTEAIEALFDL